MVPHETLISTVESALKHGASGDRAEALRYVGDLFEFGADQFSDAQLFEFDDIFTRLVADVETSARVILAKRLAPMRNAPPTILRMLAFDDAIDVAGPVLTQSPRLDSALLIENAKIKSQQHLLAISRRGMLEESVTDVLVDLGDRPVLYSIAVNPGAKFSDGGFAKLVERSQGDDELGYRIGTRRDVPRHHFLKLLAKASQAVRAKLEAEDPLNAREVHQAVAAATRQVQTNSVAHSRNYATAHEEVAKLKAAGELRESNIEAFAKSDQFEETTVALALLCDLPIEAVERAMTQDRAETILIIARAADLSWRTTKAILLLRVAGRGLAVHELEQHLASYARLKLKTAQEIVRFQRKRWMEATPRLH
jgi:uncharacterized protein (DUF2336 family)